MIDDYHELLAAWRERPSPGLGALLRHQAVAWDLDHGPIPGRTRAERQEAWARIDLEGNPRDTRRLIVGLVSFHRETAEALLRSLSPARLPDPAAGLAFAELLNAPPGGFLGWEANAFWSAVIARAIESADGEVERFLAGLVARLADSVNRRTSFERQLQKRLNLRAVAAVVAREQADLPEVAARATQLQRSASDLPALFDAVYRAVHDDGPRAVLADALQLAGDPRGAFIQLQLLDRRTPAQTRMVNDLLSTNAKAWLGPLAPLFVNTGLKFARGFPVAGKLSYRGDPAPFVGHREWRTLEVLEADGWYESAGIFAAEVFDSLHTLSGVSTGILRRPSLAGLQRLSCSLGFQGWDEDLRLASPRNLRDLTLRVSADSDFAELDWTWPVFANLDRIEIGGARNALLAARHALPLDCTWVIPSTGNRPWTYTVRGDQVEVRYGWSTEDYGWKSGVHEIVEDLGSGFRRVELCLRAKTARTTEDLERAGVILAGLGVAEIVLPTPKP